MVDRDRDDACQPPSAAWRGRPLAGQMVQSCIDAMPDMVLIFDQRRRIVAANRVLLAALGLDDPAPLLGSRPGEALRCAHAHDTPEGCGSGRHCGACGGAVAFERCLRQGTRQVQECLMTLGRDGQRQLELEVSAAPLGLGDEPLTLCTMRDIGDRKRRESLERLFLHDVANTITVISTLTELLRRGDRTSLHHELLDLSVRSLIEEINGQRALHQAEHGELNPTWAELDPSELMQALHRQYTTLAGKHDCRLAMAGCAAPAMRSDGVLLRRVLGNLVKNAIEAAAAGEVVTVSAMAADGGVVFAVHNPQVIAEDVRGRMFHRSFSTKGRGRGLGTYSARLIGERYLGGRLTLRSEAGFGTEVGLWLPLQPADTGALGGSAASGSPSRS